MLPGVPAKAGMLSRKSLRQSDAELLEEERQATAELSGDARSADGESGVADGMYNFSLPCTVLFDVFSMDLFGINLESETNS